MDYPLCSSSSARKRENRKLRSVTRIILYPYRIILLWSTSLLTTEPVHRSGDRSPLGHHS